MLFALRKWQYPKYMKGKVFKALLDQVKQENAMRYNNRSDLLQLNFTSKISLFPELYT